jgi:hypothetical protein
VTSTAATLLAQSLAASLSASLWQARLGRYISEVPQVNVSRTASITFD